MVVPGIVHVAVSVLVGVNVDVRNGIDVARSVPVGEGVDTIGEVGEAALVNVADGRDEGVRDGVAIGNTPILTTISRSAPSSPPRSRPCTERRVSPDGNEIPPSTRRQY